MIHNFDPLDDLIRVPVTIAGPTFSTTFSFALDTGASRTTVKISALLALGYPLEANVESLRLVTASAVEQVKAVRLLSVTSLARRRTMLKVAALDPPRELGVDGLLGLDFFRNTRLVLDFQKGRLRLN